MDECDYIDSDFVEKDGFDLDSIEKDQRPRKYTEADVVIVPIPNNKQFIDRTGDNHWRLTIRGYAGRKGSSGSRWWADCECGNIIIIRTEQVGRTKSCGCRRRPRYT